MKTLNGTKAPTETKTIDIKTVSKPVTSLRPMKSMAKIESFKPAMKIKARIVKAK
jgi:hypothetical protein